MHVQSRRRFAVSVLLTVAFLACGEEPLAPVDVDLTGQWSGNAEWSNDGTTTTTFLDLSLQQDEDGALTGTGTYERETVGSSPVTVLSGTYSGGSFTIRLGVEEFRAELSYNGSVRMTESEDLVLDGTLSSNSNSLGMVLSR